MPSANAIWTHGKHTFTFGGSYAYTQLNTRDEQNEPGHYFFGGLWAVPAGLRHHQRRFHDDQIPSGQRQPLPACRAIRRLYPGQISVPFQPQPDRRPALGTGTAASPKNTAASYNFDPSLYSYNDATDTLTSNGIIIAGNNKLFPTKGVSNTTLTGRQWGFAPRLGVAWSPKRFNDKVVVRAGTGLYYDRGELFSYLSPGFAEGVINGGPFGVNQTPPYVNAQSCGNDPSPTSITITWAIFPLAPPVRRPCLTLSRARGVPLSGPLPPATQWTSTITFRILECPEWE